MIGRLVTWCLVLMGWIVHGNRETSQEQHHCHCAWKQKKKSSRFKTAACSSPKPPLDGATLTQNPSRARWRWWRRRRTGQLPGGSRTMLGPQLKFLCWQSAAVRRRLHQVTGSIFSVDLVEMSLGQYLSNGIPSLWWCAVCYIMALGDSMKVFLIEEGILHRHLVEFVTLAWASTGL